MRSFIRLAVTTVSLLAATLDASDQKGAESMKHPASVMILPAKVSKTDDTSVGNVQVTYDDGTKDLWTTKGNCSLARVGQDGTVGWTVNGPETRVNASYTMRPNGTLVICRRGKILAEIKSGKAFIEDWSFYNGGSQVVLLTRASHGPADVELHDTATGKLIQSVKAYDKDLPVWATPYSEH